MAQKAQQVSGAGCRLGGFSQLAELPEEALAELDSICRVRTYPAGKIIAGPDEEADFIGCVHDGILRMQKTLYDGRVAIVGLLVEGDMFGRVFERPMSVSIEAATDVEVCAFNRSRFEKLLMQYPELDRMLLLNILNELDRARDWMMILSNQRVRGRVAGFLLILCTRFATVDHFLRLREGKLIVKVPIGRTDLAHLLGTRTESLSRAFHALADDGLIDIEKPDLIAIRDLDALAAEAGEDDLSSFLSLNDLMKVLKARDA